MNNEFCLLLQEFNPLPYITNSDKSDHALKEKRRLKHQTFLRGKHSSPKQLRTHNIQIMYLSKNTLFMGLTQDKTCRFFVP